MSFLMIPLTAVYDDCIDRQKLTEQKNPICVYSSSPTEIASEQYFLGLAAPGSTVSSSFLSFNGYENKPKGVISSLTSASHYLLTALGLTLWLLLCIADIVQTYCNCATALPCKVFKIASSIENFVIF